MRPAMIVLFAATVLTSCAVTDYDLITDNDQVANGKGSGIVNTNGKAHILHSFQFATTWADGTDETFTFVDQKANGDRVLTTYNNFSAGPPALHDDLYCNPDWQGCAVITSLDPQVGDADVFDYVFNPNCSGARTVDLLGTEAREFGECGRARMSLQDRIRFLNLGRVGTQEGLEGLFFALNASNFSILLDNGEGFRTSLPIPGGAELFIVPGKNRATLDLTHPGNAATGRAYAEFLRDHAKYKTDVTLVFNGIEYRMEIAGRRERLSNERTVMETVQRRF